MVGIEHQVSHCLSGRCESLQSYLVRQFCQKGPLKFPKSLKNWGSAFIPIYAAMQLKPVKHQIFLWLTWISAIQVSVNKHNYFYKYTSKLFKKTVISYVIRNYI